MASKQFKYKEYDSTVKTNVEVVLTVQLVDAVRIMDGRFAEVKGAGWTMISHQLHWFNEGVTQQSIEGMSEPDFTRPYLRQQAEVQLSSGSLPEAARLVKQPK